MPVSKDGASTTLRLELSYRRAGTNDRGESPPKSLIVKVASDNVMTRSFAVQQGMYLREVDFYRRLSARLTARVPTCHLADIDDVGSNFVLVLEDVHNAVAIDQLAGCDVDIARAALIELAGLHAPTWCDSSLRDSRWISNRSRAEDHERFVRAYRSLMPEFLARFGADLEPAERDVFLQLGNCRTFPLHPLTQYPFSAVHFDYRLDNLLVGTASHADEQTIVNWQTVRIADPLTDVSYFLGGCLLPDVRRAAEEQLVLSYHQAITASGVHDFSWEHCWDSYRRSAFHGFCMVVFASIAAAPTARNTSLLAVAAKRHARHALDLGAAEFLD